MTVQSFMEAYARGTTQHPFTGCLRVWQNVACFEIKPDHAGYYIHFNFIQSLYKGEGYGSQALEWLMSLAREHSVRLVGHVQRCGSDGLGQADLRRWYKRHGFSVAKRGDVTFTP